jgi:ABC-type xylose transport system permease subunit
MMSSGVKHLVLGLIIGIISVFANYMTLSFITGSDFAGFSTTNAIVVVIAYGIVTMIVGVALEEFFFKTAKKRRK